jgi:hypothetical protein
MSGQSNPGIARDLSIQIQQMFPMTADIIVPGTYTGDGSGVPHFSGIQVAGSIAADADLGIIVKPRTLPSPTSKVLHFIAELQVADNSHAAKVNILYGSCGVGVKQGDVVLTNYGVQTLTLGASDASKVRELDFIIPAASWNVNERLLIKVRFTASGWTINVVSTWNFRLAWLDS